MKLLKYQYVDANGEAHTVEAQGMELVIDRDGPEAEKIYHEWGGKTVLRLVVVENGRARASFVSARISGDSRAGSQRGIHLDVSCRKVRKSIHVSPVKSDTPRKDLGV